MLSYNEYKKLIDDNLTKFIPQIDDYASKLRESMEYSLVIGGKRLRPVLLLASCDFNGGDINDALPFACALEYIHTYSLIHDDLPSMDNDELRRGKPTNHIVFGDAIATLAGDGLLNTAEELVMEQLLKHSDDAKISNYIKAGHAIISRAGVRGMIAGQVADVLNEYNDADSDLVHYIEEHKCGDLITAPVLAGLYISDAEQSMIDDFSKYAMNLGIAFQILDDILDFEGNSELIGKNVGKDQDLGKCNYVCVHGLDAAKNELHRLTSESIDIVKKYGDKADFFINLAESMEKRKA